MEHTTIKNLLDKISNQESKNPENLIAENDLYIVIKSENKLYLIPQFNIEFPTHDKSLTYLFSKYPDGISTINELCRIKNYKSNIYTIDIDKLKNSEEYINGPNNQIDIYELIIKLKKEEREKEKGKPKPKKNIIINLDNIISESDANRIANLFPEHEWFNNCSTINNLEWIPVMNNVNTEKINIGGICNNHAYESIYKNIKWNFNTILSNTENIANISLYDIYKEYLRQNSISTPIHQGGNKYKYLKYIKKNKNF
jgi:hypothetical protein